MAKKLNYSYRKEYDNLVKAKQELLDLKKQWHRIIIYSKAQKNDIRLKIAQKEEEIKNLKEEWRKKDGK